MRKQSIFTMSLAIVLLFFASAYSMERIAVPGTGDGVAILESVGEAFTKETGISVVVPKSIGSSGGIKAVGADKAELGRVARNIKDKEKHYGLTYTPFVKVPTVFVVYKDLAIDGLSSQQIVAIYEGKITNWKEVGGPDKKIQVIRREDGDSSLNNLRRSFPGFKDLVITENSRMAEKTPIMLAVIENIEDTIGFAPYDVAVANGLKVITVDGKGPFDEGYPTYGIIAFVYKQENYRGDIKKFVDFATSEAADKAIRKAGGIPLH